MKPVVLVKRLADNAEIPIYATSGAAGCDLFATQDMIIESGLTKIIPTGLAFQIPDGLFMMIVPRSGISLNTKLRIANSPGTVDSDYRGEVGIIATNESNGEPFEVKAGERYAQAIFVPYYQVEFVEVTELNETKRGAGGYGHTGLSGIEPPEV